MRNALRAVVLAVPLLFVSACGQSDEAKDDMEVKQTYSLCPISEDSRQRLYDQVKSFADHQGARFIDRSAGAKQELRSEERRVGKECVRPCRSRWSRYH